MYLSITKPLIIRASFFHLQMGISLHVSAEGTACRTVNGIVSVVVVAMLKFKEALLLQSVTRRGVYERTEPDYPHFAVVLKHRYFALLDTPDSEIHVHLCIRRLVIYMQPIM
jgi:hypothetical protein